MRRLLAVALAGLALAAAHASSSFAASPSAGALSPLNPALSYTAGPFAVSNTSGVVEDEPLCLPDACDDFALTINVPPGYAAANPGVFAVVDVHWTDLSGQRSDIDVFVYDAAGNRVTAAATANDPEIALIPPVAGTYTVRVIPFRVTGESIAATITLGPAPPTGTLEGIYVQGSDVFSCNTHVTGSSTIFIHDGDTEPAAAIDGDGSVWVTSNPGLGGDQGMWKVTDPCGKFFAFIGGPTTGEGGGDTDVEVAPERNVLGQYNIYTASLYLANTTTATSRDGGLNFVPVVASDQTPVNDREWLAAYGAETVYLSYRSLNTGNQLFVVRSDAGGAPGSWVGPFAVYQGLVVPTTLATQIGQMVTDRRPAPAGTLPLHAGPDGEGNVYHPFILGGSQLYVAVSRDFGVTWASQLVYQAPSFMTLDHIFCWAAVDGGGNVYVAFSNDHDVFYCVSRDAAYNPNASWSRPIRVSNGLASKTSIFPAIVAGSEGRIVMTWYGSAADDSQAPDAQWHVFHTRSQNALDPAPTFQQVRVTDHVVRTGPVCQGGTLGCSGDTRVLLDDFEIAVNPVDGSSFIAYSNQTPEEGTYISRQLAGSSALAGHSVSDHSNDCPRNVGRCDTLRVGNTCLVPGVQVAADPAGDETSQNSQQDLQALYVAEPFVSGQPARLALSMKVPNLDPANIPPNGFWRMQFTGPDGTGYWVRMLKCAASPAPTFDYGHFTTGSVTDGAADAGSFTSDGLITIQVAKSRVGNPPAGSRLTGIAADTREVVGNCPGSPGAFAPIDGAAGGSYTLAGNTGCNPTPTLVGRFEARRTDRDVQIEWSSDAVGEITAWNLYRAGADGAAQRVNPTPIPMGSGGSFQWHDAPLASGTVEYRLAALGPDGLERQLEAASVDLGGGPPAISFVLAGANPFRGRTSFSYWLPRPARVTLSVFSLAGQRVRTLVDRAEEAGSHTASFETRAPGFPSLAPGLYLVRLRADGTERHLRIIALE